MMIKECQFHPVLIDSRCFRKGIVLEMTGENGSIAQSEISPLPGHSQETLEQAMQQLENLKRKILTTWWTKQSLHTLNHLGLFPSVHFGVENAILDLIQPLEIATPPLSYALLLGSPEEILQRGREAKVEGFSEAKVKLGHFSPEIAFEITEQLTRDFRLRIDLNRKWEASLTDAFCRRFAKDQFEYIEEPARNPKDLSDFAYPFALDETLREAHDFSHLMSLNHLKALILKPTMLYPISPYLHLGKKVVITSSFEGPIGIEQLKKCILRCNLQNTLHGLDSLRYFEDLENNDTMSHQVLEKISP